MKPWPAGARNNRRRAANMAWASPQKSHNNVGNEIKKRKAVMRNRLLALVEEAGAKKDITPFRIGDQVDIHQRILEGQKERVQVFSGVVIARRGDGLRETLRCVASCRVKAWSVFFRCIRRRSPRSR